MKALTNSLIQKAVEFSFLINLITFDSLTKTERIHKQVLEKISLVEVIKPLVKLNLIQEFSDQESRRSVSVTVNAKNEILNVLPKMGVVSKNSTWQFESF